MFALQEWLALVGAVAGIAFMVGMAAMARELWWKPWRIYQRLRAQGVQGPPFVPLVGNKPEFVRMVKEAGSRAMKLSSQHEIIPHAIPYYHRWSKLYGETFMYTTESKVQLVIAEPELIKQILNNKFGHFPKVPRDALSRSLSGDSLLAAEGERWAQKRRILNPGFHIDKLKTMLETMAQLTIKMLDNWDRKLMETAERSTKYSVGMEIDVRKEFKNLTADIIAHTAFGTSYEAGRLVFHLQDHQVKLLLEFRQSVNFPGQSILRVTKNLHRWKMEKSIEHNLRQLVEGRLQEKETHHDDLLGIMIHAYKGELQGNQKNLRMSIQDIVDECKTFYFAGHETTASLLTWTTMLLGLYPAWQEKVRAEVINICGGTNNPNNDVLNQLKLMSMVLNETLRLYSVVPQLKRDVHEDIKLGKLVIPKGTELNIMLIVMMHNKQLWGEDAHEFNPNRFSRGIAKASTHPMAFMPFSMGPRTCIGQMFALMEAKVVLSKLLQKFSWELSPTYVHMMRPGGILQPAHGLQILVKPLLS